MIDFNLTMHPVFRLLGIGAGKGLCPVPMVKGKVGWADVEAELEVDKRLSPRPMVKAVYCFPNGRKSEIWYDYHAEENLLSILSPNCPMISYQPITEKEVIDGIESQMRNLHAHHMCAEDYPQAETLESEIELFTVTMFESIDQHVRNGCANNEIAKELSLMLVQNRFNHLSTNNPILNRWGISEIRHEEVKSDADSWLYGKYYFRHLGRQIKFNHDSGILYIDRINVGFHESLHCAMYRVLFGE